MAEINVNELESVSGGAYSGPVFRYTIQPGDCLSVIAQRFGTTTAILVDLNNIQNPNFIRAYDVLLIPYKG